MPSTRTLLSNRFAFQDYLKSEGGSQRWLAFESNTGRRVVVEITKANRLANFETARGAVHSHLAGILDVSRSVDPGAVPSGLKVGSTDGIAIAELVTGRTLSEQLERGPMNPVKAVAWILRLAEAVQVLHARGAVHGAISPFAVIAEPDNRVIAPVLTQLMAPPVGPYCPPERLKGHAPAMSDDVWALHALLYTALTGHAPFPGATRDDLIREMQTSKPRPLAAHGVNEPVLSEIVMRGLAGDRRNRVTEPDELVKALDRWERDPRALLPKRAAPPRMPPALPGTEQLGPPDEDLVVDPRKYVPARPPTALDSTPDELQLPPPDPALVTSVEISSLTATARELPPVPRAPMLPTDIHRSRVLSLNPFERKRRVWPVVVGAAVLSGAGVYFAVGGMSTSAPATPPPAEVTPPPTAKVKAPEKPKRDVAEERNACVRSYFPEGSVPESADFSFVCAEADFRNTSRLLFAHAKNAGQGGADITVQAFQNVRKQSELGWYELAATGIIRKSCCPGMAPVMLPETAGWCEQLEVAVRRVAEDSQKAGDLAPAARSFDKAVTCLFAHKIGRPYVYDRPPTNSNRRAFQQFLSRAAISEARR